MTSSILIGAASGIGRAVAEHFHARGDRVVIIDRDEDSGKSLAKSLGTSAAFLAADMAQPGAPERAVIEAINLAGGTLDNLYYGPAILESRPLSDWTVSDWDRSMAVNLRGALFATQAAAPTLGDSAAARIIFVSSTGALRGHAGMPAYHASKAAMLGLVRSLADELAPKITVNAVCPGWIDTPFNDPFWSFQTDPETARVKLEHSIPAGRQGTPADVCGIIGFLASPDSAYITGQSFVVDGGYTAV